MIARSRLLQLAERRARLHEQARSEREALAAMMARTDAAAEFVSGALAAGRRILDELRRRPLIVIAGMALLIALRPRRALGWALKGWSAWRLYRGAQRWWQRLAASANSSTPAAR